MTNEEIVCKIKQGEDLYSVLINQNMGLFKTLHQRRDPYHYLEHEDAMSLCYEAMYRCVKYWDETAGVKFISFLYPAVSRQIIVHVKRERRIKFPVVSLNNTLEVGDNNLDYHEVLESPISQSLENCQITDFNLIKAAACEITSNFKKPRGDIVKDYLFEGLSQNDLAEKYSLSQSYISRIICNAKKDFKTQLPEYGFSVHEIHGNVTGY